MRKADWEARLNAFVEQVRERRHAYGAHDCMLFAAGAVQAQTGRDLARGHRRKYKDKLSAARHLKSLGFASLDEMIDSLLDAKPIGFAQRGDIILTDDGYPGVVFDGDTALVVVAEGADGLLRVPRAEWIKAWRCG